MLFLALRAGGYMNSYEKRRYGPRVWGTMLMDMTDKLHLVLRRWCLAFGILCIFSPCANLGYGGSSETFTGSAGPRNRTCRGAAHTLRATASDVPGIEFNLRFSSIIHRPALYGVVRGASIVVACTIPRLL